MIETTISATRREVRDWEVRAQGFKSLFPTLPNVFNTVLELSKKKLTILESYKNTFNTARL